MSKIIPKNILFLAVLLGLSPLGPLQAIFSYAEVDLSDDAYHYGLFRDGSHDGSYIEWWYFNLIDDASGIQAIFHYSIFNPDNILQFGRTNVGANIFTPQGIVHESDSFPTDLFWASDSEPQVKIGNQDVNFIEVIEYNTFHIVGSIGNGRISWDLYYEPQIAPWYAADRQHIGRRPWEQMSWLVYAPGAYVTGKVVLNGEIHHVQQAKLPKIKATGFWPWKSEISEIARWALWVSNLTARERCLKKTNTVCSTRNGGLIPTTTNGFLRSRGCWLKTKISA